MVQCYPGHCRESKGRAARPVHLLAHSFMRSLLRTLRPRQVSELSSASLNTTRLLALEPLDEFDLLVSR